METKSDQRGYQQLSVSLSKDERKKAACVQQLTGMSLSQLAAENIDRYYDLAIDAVGGKVGQPQLPSNNERVEPAVVEPPVVAKTTRKMMKLRKKTELLIAQYPVGTQLKGGCRKITAWNGPKATMVCTRGHGSKLIITASQVPRSRNCMSCSTRLKFGYQM